MLYSGKVIKNIHLFFKSARDKYPLIAPFTDGGTTQQGAKALRSHREAVDVWAGWTVRHTESGLNGSW